MLSLRQFDSTIMESMTGPQLREHTASTVLRFGAQPSNSLPAFITSFAHPVHVVDWDMSEADSENTYIDNWLEPEGQELDVIAAPALPVEGPSRPPSPTPDSQPTKLAGSM